MPALSFLTLMMFSALSIATARIGRFVGQSYTTRLVLRMAALYLLFRLLNWAMVGLVEPTGYYSSFLDHYLDYIQWLKTAILSAGKWMAALFGVHAETISSSALRIGKARLNMAAPCVGLEIMSFWAAFVLADTTRWRTKFRWCLVGIGSICLINSLRIMLLIIAMAYRWPQVGTISHHDSFNAVGYAAIIGLMFVYYKRNGQTWGRQNAATP